MPGRRALVIAVVVFAAAAVVWLLLFLAFGIGSESPGTTTVRR